MNFRVTTQERRAHNMMAAETKKDPLRIAFLVSAIRCGGAERVVAHLANFWAERGEQVVIYTIAGRDFPAFYPLSASVRLAPMDLMCESYSLGDGLRNNLRRLAALRRQLRCDRPDVLISFMESSNVLALLASIGLRVPVIVSEVAVPALQELGMSWALLRRLVYRTARALVVPSRGVCDYFKVTSGIAPVVIPNPIADPMSRCARTQSDRVEIVAAGRLSREKGFDLLLDAFSLVNRACPSTRLTIYGEGPERQLLEMRRDRLGLRESVSLPGAATDLSDKLQDADVFVLSSRYEGFGNVVVEAMAAGRAVVSFDCPTGPSEIIAHGVDGILVPNGDVPALAQKILLLTQDAALRERIGAAALQVRERYSIERVIAQWDALLGTTIEGVRELSRLEVSPGEVQVVG